MRTPEQVLGPYFPVGLRPTKGGDLVTLDGPDRHPEGDVVEIVGRVLDRRNGEPIRGAKLVIWQANAFGRYAHPNDVNPAPLDPNFEGFAEILSDANGGYRIRTVKPGAYPARPDWMRPPHIHFEVQGKFERLITQMYFPGEPLNACDRFLMSASHPDMLIAQPLQSAHAVGHRALKFDIVLARG